MGVLVCIGILAGILFVKTFTFTSKQIQVNPAEIMSVDENKAARHLSDAIKFKTISHEDTKKIDYTQLVELREYLQKTYPLAHKNIKRAIISNYSLLYTWLGSDANAKPILLMGHMDVVPVESGTEKNWTYPPFDGKIADGFIWGRGAMDDKLCVLGLLEAAERLLQTGFNPKRTIYFAFGHNEEIGGEGGAQEIAALLKSRGVQLEYVLDEGLAIITKGIIPGLSAPLALIGIAEKGYLSVELSAQTEGGHSSTPPPHTSIGILANAIKKLEDNPVPGGIRGPAQKMFEYVGPEMQFHMKMAIANLWLFHPVVEKLLAENPASNAVMRTTTAVTMLNAGIKDNVIPQKARAVVNFRILPGDTVESVLAHVKKTINDAHIQVKPLFKGTEPSPVSSTENESFKTLQRTVKEIFPDSVVAPSLVLGATDSRHYQSIAQDVYRFVPMRLVKEDLSRVHGTNERIGIKNFAQIIQFYAQLMKNSQH